MTSAILEILFLLIISCAIGVFFTYRYWKSKFNLIENDLNACREDNRELRAQTSSLTTDKNKLQSSVDTLKAEIADLKKAEKPKKTTTDDASKLKKDIKELKSQIELQQESLDEKEREIEELSKELSAKKISYYKQIDGKRYKAVTLIKADEAVAGKGDGRISKADAEIIFATISDGKSYTQVEKDTMRYLRDNYNWTDEADALFRSKVRSWAAKGHELDQ